MPPEPRDVVTQEPRRPHTAAPSLPMDPTSLPAAPTLLAAAAIWFAIALACGVLVTQIAGIDGIRHVAALQALTPYFPFVLAPVAVAALHSGRHRAAALASLAGLGVLALAAPLVFPATHPTAVGANGTRIGVVNLLYTNDRTEAIADDLAGRDLDVIVFTELTAAHLRRLDDHELAGRFVHRADQPGPLAEGVAVWSRFPMSTPPAHDAVDRSVDVRIDGPDGGFRLLAVHLPTPIYDFDGWRDDLDAIGESVDGPSSPPTVVAGDFNASYWHPRFRALLDRGLIDAHITNRRGWSMSWPTDVAIPPYVRLDHALTGHGLVADDVADFRVEGSDHTGFVVTVAPGRRTEP